MPSAFLKVLSGPHEGLNVALNPDQPLTIGRRRGELLLDDNMVSGLHAQLVPRDDAWVLQDLGSTNGTMVDGRLVREAVLKPGAEITIGQSRLVLFVRGDAEPTTPERATLELAWLLDEELVELRGPAERSRGQGEVIDQDLRLPPGLQAVVEVIAGTSDVGRVFRFQRGNVTIGRKTGEVPLNDTEVSRRHAVIELFGREMIFLRDLGSTNGTYHNGRRVSVAGVRPGDTIGVGKTVLRLQVTR